MCKLTILWSEENYKTPRFVAVEMQLHRRNSEVGLELEYGGVGYHFPSEA